MMKRTIITALLFTFSISFCMAQDNPLNVKEQIELLEKQYKAAITSAEKNFRQGQYAQAIKDYEKARVLKPTNAETINAEIEKVNRKMRQVEKEAKEIRYKELIASAEENFEQGQYYHAQQDYQKALELKRENADLINSKLAEIEENLKRIALERDSLEREHLYGEAIVSAERNLTERKYAQAKEDYLVALELKPGNADFINSKIAELGKPSQLHVYRKAVSVGSFLSGGLSGILQGGYDVFLDNRVIGNAKSKWKTTESVTDFNVKILSAEIEGRKAEIHIDFEPGKTYYVRCGLSSRDVKTGEIKTRKLKNGTTERYEETIKEHTPLFELVSANVGEREFKAIKNK